MSAAPSLCTTCRAPLAPGSNRCTSCGSVFGEDNRCPHCHGLAAIRVAKGGYVCVACSGPRERLANTVVSEASSDRLGRSVDALMGGGAAVAGRVSPAALLLRVAGVGLIGGAVFFAAIGAALSGWVAAGLIGLAGAATGGLALHLAGRVARADRKKALRRAVVELARREGGLLAAPAVARALSISATEADSVLTEMADGTRITVEITEDGGIEYVFADLGGVPSSPSLAPLRVRAPEAASIGLDEQSELSAEGELESSRHRESRS